VYQDVEKKSVKQVKSLKEAKGQSEVGYQGVQESQIKAKATVVGYPGAFIGAIVRIDGLPTMLAGNYIITGFDHMFSVSGGFTTNLNLNRDAHTSLPVAGPKMTSSPGALNKAVPTDPKKLVGVFNINKDTGAGGMVFVPKGHSLAQNPPSP